ncbi:hypothetical protein, partial [Klebsiella michiganensis]|uniref:hypothetical protein n=1 Tax=Klebsiella michiganensis TaxID=1134687 RepID=UPI0034D1F08F
CLAWPTIEMFQHARHKTNFPVPGNTICWKAARRNERQIIIIFAQVTFKEKGYIEQRETR